jgi:hypothetical protein
MGNGLPPGGRGGLPAGPMNGMKALPPSQNGGAVR